MVINQMVNGRAVTVRAVAHDSTAPRAVHQHLQKQSCGCAATLGGETCFPDHNAVEDREELVSAGRDFEILEAEILEGYVDSRPAV